MAEHTATDGLPGVSFEFGWVSWDLGEYRPFPRKYITYWQFPYETLPPVPTDPTFAFLAPHNGTATPRAAPGGYSREMRRRLDNLASEAAWVGLAIPASFVRFMSSPELRAGIRSGTGCWFTLSNRLVLCPGFSEGYLIGFLRDQQDCLIWCLCLTRDEKHCVLALTEDAVLALPASSADALYGDIDADEAAEGLEEMKSDGGAAAGSTAQDAVSEATAAATDICVCALTFEEFIYRFWIEDEISWKLAGLDKAPLTDAERCYLDYYKRQRLDDA